MEKICTLFAITMFFLISQGMNADELVVRHATGGQATALEIEGEYWYQSLGDKLVVIRKHGNGQLATRMLTTYPAEASCTDLIVHDQTMYALLDNSGVVTFSLRSANVPMVVNRQNAASLGIVPHDLVMVGDWPVVIGHGGAVRLTDGKQIVSTQGNITGIGMSMDRGIVYATNGQLVDADTNEILTSATTIVELDDNANADIGTLVYTRNGVGETEIGLLGGGMRDIKTVTGSVTIAGEYRNLLSRKSRLIVATDQAVYVIGIAPDELRVLRTFDVQGVSDVDIIASNYLAMCGEFGRGVYRIEDDQGGMGGQFIRTTASLGAMSPGTFDLRGVLVPSGSGSLYYGFDQTVTPSSDVAQTVDVPTVADVLGFRASLSSNPIFAREVALSGSNSNSLFLLPTAATTVVPIEGNFWIGTQNGVHVLGPDSTGACVELGSIELAGPIVQLIPLFDGSAAFVSEAGMIGIIERNQPVVALEQ